MVCALFHITETDGTRYFTTWVRLVEELLLEIMPVSPEMLERLKKELPKVYTEVFKGFPTLAILDCLHWELESASDT